MSVVSMKSFNKSRRSHKKLYQNIFPKVARKMFKRKVALSNMTQRRNGFEGRRDAASNSNDVDALRAAFQIFDVREHGSINLSELIFAVDTYCRGTTKYEIKQLLEEMNQNGSGRITFDDFANMAHETMPQQTTNEEMM